MTCNGNTFIFIIIIIIIIIVIIIIIIIIIIGAKGNLVKNPDGTDI